MPAFEFRLADVGEGIHEVELLRWAVRPGDSVAAFQPLCQVESAKATVELTSPVAGTVVETRIPEGGTAQVGQVLAVIDQADQWVGIVGSAPLGAGHDPPAAPSARDVPSEVEVKGAPAVVEAGRPVRAAPLVRRVAKERGIALENIVGSGPGGRIRVADLEHHADQRERVPLRGVRRRMAEHMAEAARHVPAVTALETFDVEALVQLRQELLGPAEAEGARLTYLPFVVRATVEALRAVPEANATFDEQEPAILISRLYHIGVAVAAPGGLVVPVIKHADRLSLLELANELTRLTSAARSQTLSPADVSGGTFTISSFGGLGSGVQFATPIVNYPEVAILGIGRIEAQPRVVDGQVVPRQCLGISFTFDHRVLDGEAASRFLAALRRYLEHPAELLLRLR
jgi:pyruvate dehydrogenase E2 component (dihydrolipoyllysine-residue acetyltransferase)